MTRPLLLLASQAALITRHRRVSSHGPNYFWESNMTTSAPDRGGVPAVVVAAIEPRFSLGQVVATPAALALLAVHGVEPAELLVRHLSGDWGQVCTEDALANDEALKVGNRVLSSYVLPLQPSGRQKGEASQVDRVWVITEHDRSSTCVLLPSEY